MRAVPRTVVLTTSVALIAACDSEDASSRFVGQLESDRIELVAESAEPVLRRAVAEGERVAAGQLLLLQDDRRARARVAELEALRDERQARLDELTRGPRKEQIVAARANVNGAERDLEFRQLDFERASVVHEQKLGSPETLDRARAALDAARAGLEFHNARLAELLSGTTVEELRQVESALHAAEARLTAAKIDLEHHSMTAPADAIVDSILFEVGERPPPGVPALILLAGEQPFARSYVPEELRVHVPPGTEVRVHVDGLENPVPGRVRWVSKEASFTPYYSLTERDRGRLSFVAKIDLLGVQDRLADGVPVEIELAIPTSNGR